MGKDGERKAPHEVRHVPTRDNDRRQEKSGQIDRGRKDDVRDSTPVPDKTNDKK